MKNYYFVSFTKGEDIHCTNLATAETARDVYAAYADRAEVSVQLATADDVESAQRKRMPVKDCPHIEPKPEQVKPELPEGDQEPETEPEQPETAEAKAPAASYEIRENYTYNSREVYFSGKPAEETRTALKALKMRWNSAKRCWYGYAAESQLIAAIQGAELTANPETGAAVITEGYMGGGAIYGGKSQKYLYGAELAAAIRADIKAAGIKGVTVRAHTYSGGQSIKATVTIERGDLVQGYRIEDQELLHDLNSHGAFDGSRWVYYSRELDNPDTWAELVEKVSAYEVEKYAKSRDINHFHIDSHKELSAAFIAKLRAVCDIIAAYRYDESNSMVDYFETNFYYDIETKPGKSWAA